MLIVCLELTLLWLRSLLPPWPRHLKIVVMTEEDYTHTHTPLRVDILGSTFMSPCCHYHKQKVGRGLFDE